MTSEGSTAGEGGGGARMKVQSWLLQYVTILNWLPHYTKMDAVGDFVAGVTLGLTMMPQAIAYASLAGLSAQYGLYSSFMGGLVYMVFGTIKEASIGITSLMALVTFEYTHDLPVEFVFLLTFLCGCVQLLMGLLNLGILVDFISRPVTSGFTTATSLIIVASQLKGLLGLRAIKASNFVDNVVQIAAHVGETRLWDAVLGGCCIAVLLAIRKMKDLQFGPKEPSQQSSATQILNKCLWFITIARNAIIVLICSVMAFKFSSSGLSPFLLSGKIQSGLPPLGPPAFSLQSGNTSYTFLEMCGELGSGIIVTPIVSVLANVAIAKAFSAGKTLDATQEMLTLGLCNVFGSFVQSTPTTGAFTRSAVSNASGVRTPMAGLYSATLILLALSYLTPYFYYIPRATLSAVLISAVVFMIECDVMVELWNKSKKDLFALLLTLCVCLVFGVEVGLLVGAVFNASQLIYFWARPAIDVKLCKGHLGGEYVRVTPDIGLLYPAMDYLRTELGRIASSDARGKLPVVVSCENFRAADFTAAQGIQLLLKDFKCYHQPLVFTSANRELVDYLCGCNIEGFQHVGSESELAAAINGCVQDGSRLPVLSGMEMDSLETRVLLDVEAGTPAVPRSKDHHY